MVKPCCPICNTIAPTVSAFSRNDRIATKWLMVANVVRCLLDSAFARQETLEISSCGAVPATLMPRGLSAPEQARQELSRRFDAPDWSSTASHAFPVHTAGDRDRRPLKTEFPAVTPAKRRHRSPVTQSPEGRSIHTEARNPAAAPNPPSAQEKRRCADRLLAKGAAARTGSTKRAKVTFGPAPLPFPQPKGCGPVEAMKRFSAPSV